MIDKLKRTNIMKGRNVKIIIIVETVSGTARIIITTRRLSLIRTLPYIIINKLKRLTYD